MRTIYRVSDGAEINCEKDQLEQMLQNENFTDKKPNLNKPKTEQVEEVVTRSNRSRGRPAKQA